MVEATGFEPVTSCMPCKRSPGLSYAPTIRADGQAEFFEYRGDFSHLSNSKDGKNIAKAHCCQEHTLAPKANGHGSAVDPEK